MRKIISVLVCSVLAAVTGDNLKAQSVQTEKHSIDVVVPEAGRDSPVQEPLQQVEHYQERHWRFKHKTEGVIHVWHPEHTGQLKGIVVYAHGDSSNNDRVWQKAKMAQQFRESNLQALFIIPEVPFQGWKTPRYIRWKGKLGRLIQFVLEKTGVEEPGEQIVLMAHSAGYRTIVTWLNHPSVTRVIFSDSAYGYFGRYNRWLRKKGNRMILMVAGKGKQTTEKWARNQFANRYDDTVFLEGDPKTFSKNLPMALPKVVYITADMKHSAIARYGGLLPTALKLTQDQMILANR